MPNENKQSCATPYKTMIGGQALIEGIMMLGPEKKAVVVRKPDGELEEQVVITIRDYGPGVPADELPFIKQKFYKGSSKARGSGIGLAVCEEIVTRHGGTLDVDNAEGGGFMVTIRLPLHAAQQ